MQRFKRLLISALLLSSFSMAAVAASPTTQPPLIVPKPLSVVLQKQCFAEAAEEYCADIQITFEATGVPWLDLMLLEKLDMRHAEHQQPPTSIEQQVQTIQQQAAAWLAEGYAEIQEARAAAQPYFVAYDYRDRMSFIAQRNHLASFKQFFYGYTGGAHGMHSTRYLLFDLNTRQQLLLPDILQRFAETKLLDKLRELYRATYAEYVSSWLSDSLAEQAETLLTDNFIFNEQGLTFSYPPYVLGPYSEGEVRLTLAYHQLIGIIKPEYILAH